tara:strand:+ start:2739 stop:5180 length:2442 start_codon:yes stop_codon:yes gene_type:complete
MTNNKLLTLATPNNLKKRRTLLSNERNLSYSYVKSLNKYSYSQEKISMLYRNINQLNRYKKTINLINNNLETRKNNNFPYYTRNSNTINRKVTDFIDKTKGKAYRIPFNKVVKITGTMSSTHVLSINYYYSDGNVITITDDNNNNSSTMINFKCGTGDESTDYPSTDGYNYCADDRSCPVGTGCNKEGQLDSTYLIMGNSTTPSKISDTPVNTNSGNTFEYYLGENDFIESIKNVSINNGEDGTGIIIKTTNNVLKIKPVGVSFSKNDYPLQKNFKIINENISWNDHFNKHNNVDGYTMASIANDDEFQEILELATNQGLKRVFLGGTRKTDSNNNFTGNNTGKDGNTWRWVDGSTFSGIEHLFSGGEPNNWRNLPERHLEVYVSSGKINDIYDSRKQPAVYSKMEPPEINESVTYAGKDEQITPGLTNEVTERYTFDENKIKLANNFLNTIKDFNIQLDLDIQDINSIISNNNTTINLINIDINRMRNQIEYINTLNKSAKEGFTNINAMDDLFYNIKKMFVKEGYTSAFYDKALNKHRDFNKDAIKEINETKNYKDLEDNYLLKLEKQQDTIFSKVLNDYLTNNSYGSGLNDVYNKLESNNTINKRFIEIDEYQMKKYKDLTDILKIALVVAILIFILLFLNKKELLDTNLTYALIIALVVALIMYTLFKLYLIYIKKDKKTYEKNTLTRDKKDLEEKLEKEKQEEQEQKNINDEENLKLNLGTCLNSDCCTDGMRFDEIEKKCILEEKFHNYFDKNNKIEQNKLILVDDNNLKLKKETFTNIKEFFVSKPSETKSNLLKNSLLKSDQFKI